MSPLGWLPEYELGHPTIDSQHRKWFKLTNDFVKKASANEADFSNVQNVLESLVAYAQYHFGEEERFMRAFGYPTSRLTQHVAAHDAFVNRVNELAQLCRQSDPETMQKLSGFLTSWLIQHIVEVDVKYIRYYERLGGDEFSGKRAQVLREAAQRRRRL